MFCQHVCLKFISSNFCVLSERLASTLGVPTWSVPQDVSVVFQVPVVATLLAHSSCLSKAPSCVSHLCGLKQIIGVDAFHARLSDTVACVTLQRLNGYSPIISTPPEVEHLVFGHPARSLSTPTFNVFSFCVDQRKLSTLLSLPLKYRAILLSLGRLPTVLGSRRVASLLSLRKVYRISSRSNTGAVQPTIDNLHGCTCPNDVLQMLLLQSLPPCCLVSPLMLPTESVRWRKCPCRSQPSKPRSDCGMYKEWFIELRF